MAMTVTVPASEAGWLRGRAFDGAFVVGIAAVALASGWLVVTDERLFVPILLADLWLLGYHHVIATYTRLCFDRKSFAEHRFLIFVLPLIVLGAVVAAATAAGLWILASVYFYWQWFHYTRQSWGVSQVYRRKAGGIPEDHPRLSLVVFYALPVWGILARSHQDPGLFLGMELRMAPVPGWAVDLAGAAAVLAVGWWCASRLVMWARGRLPVAHTLYMLSHFVVFAVAYLLIEDITKGWLVVNIWHNAQYLLFVWMFNNNRYRGGVDPAARLLSMLSQTRNAWLYFLVLFCISTTIYATIESAVAAILPTTFVIYQTINFHHYVVDGLIWKVRRKPLQATLGIASGA
jgi:hypothetical protein